MEASFSLTFLAKADSNLARLYLHVTSLTFSINTELGTSASLIIDSFLYGPEIKNQAAKSWGQHSSNGARPS